MKRRIAIFGIAGFAAVSAGYAQHLDPQPGCIADRYGNAVCGPAGSRCLKDLHGDVKCSPADGGIALDRYKTPVCGPGRCALDRYGEVVCSRVAKGSAVVDIHGEMVCTGGCVNASAAACVLPSR